MKILNLTREHNVYTSNVNYVLGNSNAIDDVNTLVDGDTLRKKLLF